MRVMKVRIRRFFITFFMETLGQSKEIWTKTEKEEKDNNAVRRTKDKIEGCADI